MFQGWRNQLKEAETACNQGRLEQASRLLDENALEEFSPGQRLRQRIADAWTKRARDKLLTGEFAPAWKDLEVAESMVGETDSTIQVRREASELLTHEVHKLLAAGNTTDALSRLDAPDARQIKTESVASLWDTARRLQTAQQLRRRGKFGESLEQLAAAQSQRPDLGFMAEQEEQTREAWERYQPLSELLHQQIDEEKWDCVVQTAQQMLDLAPEAALAQTARRRGWEIVTQNENGMVSKNNPTTDDLAMTQPYQSSSASAPKKAAESANLGTRFLLWVDAVGGYLVCLDDEIDIGQATPNNSVHLAIIADISRRHARIRREGESYLLEPVCEVRLNGEPTPQTALLSDGDLIEMGPVKMRFRQPHALSSTARLDFESRHRTQPSADSVLLFAESCVLGPGENNHVVSLDWEHDVVLYRKDDGLSCRAISVIEVDDRKFDTRAEIRLDSRICGEDFSMSLEPL